MRQMMMKFIETKSAVPITADDQSVSELPQSSADGQSEQQEPGGTVDLTVTTRHTNGKARKPSGHSALVQRETSINLKGLGSWSSCSQDCGCRCHFSESSYNSWRWLQPVLGSWIIRCNSIPYHSKPKCSDTRCKR